jgi:hypothetical protein
MKRTLLNIITACAIVLACTACWAQPAADEWRDLPHLLVFEGPEIVRSRAGVVVRVPGAYAGWLGHLTSETSLLLRALIAGCTGRCPAEAQLTVVILIENTSDKTVLLHPDRGSLLIGDHEINVRDCLLWTLGDGIQLAPGEEARMGLIIGVPGIPPGELRRVRYELDGPVDRQGRPLSGRNYQFDFTLEPHSGG